MAHLVSNRTHLYKYNSHLLKTPLTIELTADNYAYYVVAGHYDNNGLPDRGFQLEDTYENTVIVGYQCNSNLLNPRDPRQIWRQTSINPVPTCWYGGAYATSAPTRSGAYTTCESCAWLGAVHFSIPETATVSSAYTTIRNLGIIKCYGSAGSGSTNNSIWNDNAFYWGVAGVGSLLTPSQMNSNASRVTWNAVADGGTPRSVFDLWKFSGSNKDGGIPALAAPISHRFNLTQTMLSTLNSNHGIWMCTTFDAFISSSTNYIPQFSDSSNGYWGCFATHVVNKMTVTIN